jgi:hypothetical protein
VKIMMPYDAYRLFQAERTKSPSEIRLADRQAAQVFSAVSGLARAIGRALPSGRMIRTERAPISVGHERPSPRRAGCQEPLGGPA